MNEAAAPQSPCSSRLAMDFDPLIRERAYRRRNLLSLTVGADRLDLSGVVVVLKPIPESYLAHLEESPALEVCLEKSEQSAVETLERSTFHCSPLRMESVIVAASLGLWRTTGRSNDIIEATRARFLGGMEEGRREKKSKLPVKLFFNFLNEMEIDVVILSTDRERMAVFCAKSARRRQLPDIDAAEDEGGEPTVRCRTLLALEYSTSGAPWSPMQLPMLRRGRRVSINVSETRDGVQSDTQNASRARVVAFSTGDLAQSSNTDTMAFDRTVYNPQMVLPKVSGSTQSIESEKQSEADSRESPFIGMRYPNINQLDLQVMEVLRRGLHPVLRRNRIRFLIAFPTALIGFIVGLVLIIHVNATIETFCRQTSTDTSAIGSEESSDSDCHTSFCDPNRNSAIENAATAFLFRRVSGPGHFVVAATCGMFVASLLAAAVSYFTTRTLARENSRPLFYIVMTALHIAFSVATCAFSAYALSVLIHTVHEMPCSSFQGNDAASCGLAQILCPDYLIEVHIRHSTPVTSALSILFFCLCVVEFLASLVPPMPDKGTLEKIQKAKPETYVFYPSVYAPDGISDTEKVWLRRRIARRLHMQLREQVQQQEMLLTRSATIGEMMLANREQSLSGSRPRETPANTANHWSENEPQNPLHYMASLEDASGGENSSLEPGAYGAGRRELPLQLLDEVARISRRVKPLT
ncbi:hypothetical protein DQ04_03701040 [Trypanosoma grayi]|uniref:hypothetical protein n=1 Tax=Trypanosoma grayi TaxID=71804 RepID=UPI0004F41CAC|nr:hypothetical protein DQ04_03701040 [Trypanosoma grayi]KEG10448.1 hypothetical protein DQ04_03701040 [Trypanosoma grayi]